MGFKLQRWEDIWGKIWGLNIKGMKDNIEII